MLLLLVYQDKQESPYFPFVSHIRHDRMEIHLPRKKCQCFGDSWIIDKSISRPRMRTIDVTRMTNILIIRIVVCFAHRHPDVKNTNKYRILLIHDRFFSRILCHSMRLMLWEMFDYEFYPDWMLIWMHYFHYPTHLLQRHPNFTFLWLSVKVKTSRENIMWTQKIIGLVDWRRS